MSFLGVNKTEICKKFKSKHNRKQGTNASVNAGRTLSSQFAFSTKYE